MVEGLLSMGPTPFSIIGWKRIVVEDKTTIIVGQFKFNYVIISTKLN